MLTDRLDVEEKNKVNMTPWFPVDGRTMNQRKTNHILGKLSYMEVNNLCSQNSGGKPLYYQRFPSKNLWTC